jgi:hypothetical protein
VELTNCKKNHAAENKASEKPPIQIHPEDGKFGVNRNVGKP